MREIGPARHRSGPASNRRWLPSVKEPMGKDRFATFEITDVRFQI
jgi:hypothetical protein